MKRVITVVAIGAAVTGAAVPAIASADTKTTTGQGSASPSKQQVCDALPGLVNTLGAIGGAMDLGSAAQIVVQAAQQAIYDAGTKACPA
jgi:hypothetical protein